MRQSRELSSKWRRVSLGELAPQPDAFVDGPFGSNLKTEHYTAAGARVVRLQNIGRGTFLDNDKAFVSPEHFADLVRHSVVPGDIVVAALGDGARPAGRACLIPDHFGRGLVKADCFRLRLPREVIAPTYLVHFMNSPECLRRIAEMMRGATRPRVTLGMLRALSVPLRPLPEQMRIVSWLDSAGVAVERAKAAAEAQIEAARVLRAAELRETFDGPRAGMWEWKSLSELLAEPMKTGISRPQAPGSTMHCLTLSSVRNGWLDTTAQKPVDVTKAEAAGNWVRPGAFYVVRGNGNRSLVGRGALAAASMASPVLYPDLLIQLVANPDVVDVSFLQAAWDNPRTRAELEARARTSAGIFKINQANLGKIRIPVSSLPEQIRTVAALRERLALAEVLLRRTEERFRELTALPASLLRQAFSGEL